MTQPCFRQLPPGSVRPRGWLADQLRLQADGLTGSLPEIWPDVGSDSAWLGGSGEAWERGPYYLDGLLALAHALEDQTLLSESRKWVEAILASQRPDGWFGPDANDDWWSRMVALKALIQHADATADERIEAFVTGYLRYLAAELPGRPLSGWGRARGAEILLVIEWLHERSGERWVLDLAALVVSQLPDWDHFFVFFPHREVTRRFHMSSHVVNIGMALKTPAILHVFDGAPGHREAVDAGLANLDRFHGQVHGMFSGDEFLAGPTAARGVELCAVVETMFSLGQLIRVWGSVDHADRLERIGYNLLPAATTADVTAHQYHQQANQVLVSVAHREWTWADDDCTIFGLDPNDGCCTANLHQGWPKLLQSFWLETPDGGLAAAVHGPSAVRWETSAGTIEIEATTTYPFDETIRYDVRTAPGGPFPLLFRKPGWCETALLLVNGEQIRAELIDGYLRVDRAWATGDVIVLRLPVVPRLLPRANGAVGVALGAVTLAYSPGEIWERIAGSEGFGDWEVRPRRNWRFALAVDEETIRSARVERMLPESLPFGQRSVGPHFDGVDGHPLSGLEGVPLRVWVPARVVPDWPLVNGSAADPSTVVPPSGPGGYPVPLIPYGSARIRIAEFPDAGVWKPAEPPRDPDAAAGAEWWEIEA